VHLADHVTLNMRAQISIMLWHFWMSI